MKYKTLNGAYCASDIAQRCTITHITQNGAPAANVGLYAECVFCV